jgi:competence protein ComEC
MKRAISLMLILLSFLLLSCESQNPCSQEYESGFRVTSDVMKFVQNYQSSDTEQTTAPKEYSEDTVCYWTKSGSVWHLTPNCSYLRNSKNIISGTVKDALLAEKTKPCSRCCG